MDTTSPHQITQRIIEFVNAPGCCLFAGAGVGMRANLPSWSDYLEYLADFASKYEEETAILIRKRIRSGHFTKAAHLYKDCVAIPEGELYRALGAPFTENPHYEPRKLFSLMTLPFCAAVTTNYDRSLHDAYSALYTIQKESGLTLTAPQYVELGDPAMGQAIYWKKFYIARIHGRAEIPESIVIDSDDYEKVNQDDNYKDFLFNILTRYRCLFIGYSFLDPAISNVFKIIEQKVPKSHKMLHLALLPSNSDRGLTSKLLKYNIEIINYSPDNNHELLWNCINFAQKEIRTAPRVAPDRTESVQGLGRFIASAFSRLRIGTNPEPLIEIVIEGIVAQAIIDNGKNGSDRESLIAEIKRVIGLPDDQLKFLLSRAVDGLVHKGLCIEEDGKWFCVPGQENEFDQAMRILVDGICNRLKVREGVDATEETKQVISKILNKLFISRGWDLGAHFAGGRSSDSFDAWNQIQNYIVELVEAKSNEVSAISNAIFDLFRHPEDKEAEVLTDIGRVSFGIELAMNNSQKVAAKAFMLPKTVYFDSNVLMPAIVEGHPFSLVYADAIKRMQLAASSSGNRVQLYISLDFLDEIVNHRRLAIEQVRSLGLEDPRKLKRHILLFSADGTNVFLGAYASWVGRSKNSITFAQFLSKVAPYTNIDTLSEFLHKKGVETTDLTFKNTDDNARYARINQELHSAYERRSYEYYTGGGQEKASILIDHESAQITRLVLDIERGRSPIFVTADKRLMSLCSGPVLGKCSNSIVSHLGFIQMIDLIIGLDTDRRALSRLVWGIGYTDEQTVIRNYIIDLALQSYDDAMTRAMWEIIEEISAKTAEQANELGLNLFSNNVEEKARIAEFFDRFEEGFFENMAIIIKKRESEK